MYVDLYVPMYIWIGICMYVCMYVCITTMAIMTFFWAKSARLSLDFPADFPLLRATVAETSLFRTVVAAGSGVVGATSAACGSGSRVDSTLEASILIAMNEVIVRMDFSIISSEMGMPTLLACIPAPLDPGMKRNDRGNGFSTATNLVITTVTFY